jgi:hypothetical protein
MPPPVKPPPALFRELLAASPAERQKLLADKSENSRRVITSKLREYEPLSPGERELRLRTLDLTWHLMQLLRMAPSNRTARLAALPERDRTLVEDRLKVWDSWPPELRKEVLQNTTALGVWVNAEIKPGLSAPMVPDERREQLRASVRALFELTDREKEGILRDFTDTQRAEIRKAILLFGAMPKEQRDLCVRGLTKFASLTPEERQQFIKNCQEWQAMSPTEREAWRRVVQMLRSRPPLPSGVSPSGGPPLPPLRPKPIQTPGFATNG